MIRCPPSVEGCYVCGPRHPHGLALIFRRRGRLVTTSFVVRRAHQGFRGILAGGLLAHVFDCLTYRVPIALGVVSAVTARLEVDYRRPVPVGRRLRFTARLVRRRGRVFEITARAQLDRAIAGEARAIYVEVPRARILL